MNRHLLCAIALSSLSFLMAGATVNAERPTLREILSSKKPAPLSRIEYLATRSADEPQTDFTASYGQVYYYGDLLENGTSAYYLNISTMELFDGQPTASGQMLRALLLAEPTPEGSEPKVPVGTFVFPADLDDIDSYLPGTIMIDDTDMLDIFPNPDDPDDTDLYAYSYMPTDGTVTISDKGEGKYEVVADFPEMWLWDENYEEVLDERPGHAEYTGELPILDPLAYNPLTEDTALDVTGASGRYTEGDYSITFYSVELDEEGFITGPGQLLNVELFTPEVTPMNLDDLLGEFTPVDVFTDGPLPGHFGKGVWYEMMENYYVAICTELSIYTMLDGDPRESAIGLADGGTVKVSKGAREGDFRFDFDLVTVEGVKITGSWEGPIAEYISDFSSDAGSDTIPADKFSVRGAKGCVIAPDGAEVFDLSGVSCGTTGLRPGCYIVKAAGKSAKVFVK